MNENAEKILVCLLLNEVTKTKNEPAPLQRALGLSEKDFNGTMDFLVSAGMVDDFRASPFGFLHLNESGECAAKKILMDRLFPKKEGGKTW